MMSERQGKRYTSRFKFQVMLEVLKGSKTIGLVPVALVAVLLAGVFCRRAPENGLIFYRFIDNFTTAHVIESPLQRPQAAALGDRVFPVSSSLTTEDSRVEASFGIKRKLMLWPFGPVEINVLFAPPRSEYRYTLPLREDGIIDFGIGIVRDANSLSLRREGFEYGGGSIDFLILMESAGQKKVVFQQRLMMPPARESQTVNYSHNRITLPARDQDTKITFITAGSSDVFAFWHNPVFFVPNHKMPNVVILSIDTLRSDHLGCMGYPKPVSPSIDAMAADGAVFLNTYASAPWTLPSYISLMTGLNCIRHRIYYESDRLDPAVPTLADQLRRKGYACEAVTGAGYLYSGYGFSKGFDSYGMGQRDMQNERMAEETAKEAGGWIASNSDRPFFLFVHTYQVHNPYKSPDPYPAMFVGDNPRWKKFDIVAEINNRGGKGFFLPFSSAERENIIGLYDAGIRYTDDALVKPLLETLRRNGLYDRTLIILTSDHGEEFFEHGGWDHTHSVYDELIKVPLIVKMPGSKYRGRRIASIVRLTDVMPTVLEVCGVPFEESRLDGRSLLSVLSGEERNDRVFLAELAENVAELNIPQRLATNEGRRKIILNQPFSKERQALFLPPPRIPPPVELFDLAADPGETKNIADAPDQASFARVLLRRVQEIARLIPKKDGVRGRVSKELEDQLRALGYIR